LQKKKAADGKVNTPFPKKRNLEVAQAQKAIKGVW